MPRVTLSADGRRELEQEMQRLEAERPTIAEQIRQAREQGSDPTENLDLQAVVPGGLPDVGEGEVPLRVRDILDLIEAGQRSLHVRGVGQRLLALPGEGEDAVRQPVPVARVQFAVRGVWLPGRSGRQWSLTLCGRLASPAGCWCSQRAGRVDPQHADERVVDGDAVCRAARGVLARCSPGGRG